MLKVEALGKRYGSRWLFRNLEFELSAGDALVVLGHNGSGKSTLLRVIADLVRPTEGTVQVPEGDQRMSIGLSTLELSLYAQMSAVEHLEFAGKMRGCDPRSAELLERVGLDPDVLAGQMSTGMKARLRMALAVQHQPKVLLLDEPGAGLDAAGRELAETICREQRARGVLVVATNDPLERRFGTHELELAS